VLGEDHPDTLWIMGELALIFQQQGQLEHAEELLVAVLEKRRKLLGDDYSQTRWTMEVLANLYQSMGKIQAAEELERLIGDQ
jgi:Tfp pilus assembly protein PilF